MTGCFYKNILADWIQILLTPIMKLNSFSITCATEQRGGAECSGEHASLSLLFSQDDFRLQKMPRIQTASFSCKKQSAQAAKVFQNRVCTTI